MDLTRLPKEQLIQLKKYLDAKEVLETAKKTLDNLQEVELIFATLNKEGVELPMCEQCKGGGSCSICENIVYATQEISTPPSPIQSNKLKIVCAHCSYNFEYLFTQGQSSQIKCSNCFSILDSTGKIMYPPQVKNFNLSCPKCQARNNWLIIDKKDNENKIRCLSCAKEYNVKFKQISADYETLLSKIKFVRVGGISCLQCGTYNEFGIPSNQKKIDIKCKKCGLHFDFDVIDEIKRDIENIEECKVEEKKDKEEKKMFVLEEAKLEISEQDLNEFEGRTLEAMILEEAKKLSCEEEKNLPDGAFAVVVTAKNKATGEPRKIRKYPIEGTSDDKTRVHSALRYLGMPRNQEELQKYGVSVEPVIKKVLARAKELGMEELFKRHKMEKSKVYKLLRKVCLKSRNAKKEVDLAKATLEKSEAKTKKFLGGIKKFSNKIRELNATTKSKNLEVASLKQQVDSAKVDVENTKKFYLEKATLIVSRRNELGDFVKELTDEKVADDKEYELAKAKKVLAEKEHPKLETATLRVGSKQKDDDWYGQKRKEVNKSAYGHLEQVK